MPTQSSQCCRHAQKARTCADILEERKDQGAAVERRPEAVHLYGVDRLSTRECLQYFEDYGASRVEWLDDSSCNIVFNDLDSAKRAMVGKGRPFGPGDVQELQGRPFSACKSHLSHAATRDPLSSNAMR